jgi:tetratricopeptide (TPR) repeat protein
MGDFEKAKADYEVSMQQAPGFVDAWRLGALAYAELDMHDQARAAMNQALSLSPGCDAMQILSNEYWEMGRRTWAGKDENLDNAIRYYQLSAEISPTNAQAWINLGGMYYVKKDLVNARTYWKKALQCKPNDEEALLWLNRTGGVQ